MIRTLRGDRAVYADHPLCVATGRSKKEISVSGIPESAWSVAIIPLPPVVVMGPVLNGLGLNPDTPVNPASVMKLVTTRAALGLLGPQFRHQTRIATTGRLESGVLRGDLFFRAAEIQSW